MPKERQRLYRLVAQILEDLEQSAPWDDLYYPPDAPEAFLAMQASLLGVANSIPGRISQLVHALAESAVDDETRQTLEEADFYFVGIHSMCAHDLGRLRELLEPYGDEASASKLALRDRNFLCEVAADLKGKYSSALMGATSSIVGEGIWTGVAVEPILFPEKGAEAHRNQDLVSALQRSLEAIKQLAIEVPFDELLARWRAGARVDPYALADLSTFRGILGQLLKRRLRRALYSGDYHQIQRRENALAVRFAELEAVHHRTWVENLDSPAAAPLYKRLVQLTLEVTTILDVDLTEQLIGGKALRDLRAAVTSDRAAAESGDGKAKRKPLSDELEPLVALTANEDLETFLELLLGSVLKRASFTAVARASEESRGLGDLPEDLLADIGEIDLTPEPPSQSPVLPPVDLDLLPEIDESALLADPPAKAAREPAPAPTPVPAPVAPIPPPAPAPPPPAAKEEAPAAHAKPAPSPEKKLEALRALHDLLVHLQSSDNPHWSSFRMLHRLLERHTRIPPSMMQGAHPFLFEVLNTLVPQLEAAAAVGAVPPEARKKLVQCCLALTDDGLTPEQMAEEVPGNLSRLQRLLEGMTAATAAQLRE